MSKKDKPFDLKSITKITKDLELELSNDTLELLCNKIDDLYHKSTHHGMSFDELKKCSRTDIEQYRNAYQCLLNVTGTVTTFTTGFHFSLPRDNIHNNNDDYAIENEERGEYVKKCLTPLTL